MIPTLLPSSPGEDGGGLFAKADASGSNETTVVATGAEVLPMTRYSMVLSLGSSDAIIAGPEAV